MSAKKEDISHGLSNLQESFSSGLHSLQEKVGEKKDLLSKALPPMFQSTQDPILSTKEEREADLKKQKELEEKVYEAQRAFENSTLFSDIENTKNDFENKEKSLQKGADSLRSSVNEKTKDVRDFLHKEAADASQYIGTKTQGLSDAASSLKSKAEEDVQHAKSTLSDTVTDISSSITNTLHNIETGVENAGKDLLGGLGAKAHEAGDFIAGTEKEIDEKLDDNELKNEVVSAVLEKSLLK
ncbi:hypothetical protein HHI36_013859 [Cryptolaemus montrouzieri]|uniref:Uncharacterized protein n=1 Tax=Cryptolaemus montrouzieri TaxID=559131 RepID=A0ABD2N1T5_9CUCU